jgi:hypothetical protein
MSQPAILVVAGASGVGKTTLVRALEARNLEGVRCYYFDSVGMPSPKEMTAEFGSPSGWQEAMTYPWINRLAENVDGARIAILDGQVRPSVAQAAFAKAGVSPGRIVLVDCADDVRNARLRGPRNQPALASDDMTAWAKYLRGQAHALALPTIDTTRASIATATDALLENVLAIGSSPTNS